MSNDSDLPQDIAAKVLELGKVQWAVTEAQDALDHAKDTLYSVQKTQEHFDLPFELPMQFIALEGTNTVLGYIGVSPNSPIIARTMVGLWNAFHDALADPNGGALAAYLLGTTTKPQETPAVGHGAAGGPDGFANPKKVHVKTILDNAGSIHPSDECAIIRRDGENVLLETRSGSRRWVHQSFIVEEQS